MGISEAREAAGTMRAKVQREGADPIAEARCKRAQAHDPAAGIGTLATVLDLYGSKAGATLKSWPECRRRIAHVFAALLDKPLARLEASELQIDVLELGVAAGMAGTFACLGVGLQAEAEPAQQAADQLLASREASLAQRRRQMALALAHP